MESFIPSRSLPFVIEYSVAVASRPRPAGPPVATWPCLAGSWSGPCPPPPGPRRAPGLVCRPFHPGLVHRRPDHEMAGGAPRRVKALYYLLMLLPTVPTSQQSPPPNSPHLLLLFLNPAPYSIPTLPRNGRAVAFPRAVAL